MHHVMLEVHVEVHSEVVRGEVAPAMVIAHVDDVHDGIGTTEILVSRQLRPGRSECGCGKVDVAKPRVGQELGRKVETCGTDFAGNEHEVVVEIGGAQRRGESEEVRFHKTYLLVETARALNHPDDVDRRDSFSCLDADRRARRRIEHHVRPRRAIHARSERAAIA